MQLDAVAEQRPTAGAFATWEEACEADAGQHAAGPLGGGSLEAEHLEAGSALLCSDEWPCRVMDGNQGGAFGDFLTHRGRLM